MARVLDSRFDISLDVIRAVAWGGEPLRIGEQALTRIGQRRQSFLKLLASEAGAKIYGVTAGQGEMIHQDMTADEVDRLARLKPLAAAVSFGEPYPERVVRGIIVARFANILEGHAAATPRLTQALAELLNQGPLPKVSQSGQGGPGEILALYPLFAEFSKGFELEPGERGALINGAPCGAALLADAALAARGRLELTQQVLALAIAAFNAPLEHYEEELGNLYGGTHHGAAFKALGTLLDWQERDTEPRSHQAPVAYRIIPSLLGQAHWALSQAEQVAESSLSAVTHNPVYLSPHGDFPDGRCISSGGYHNSLTAPLLDGLAALWADLCLLCERLCCGLMNGRVSGFPDFLTTGRSNGEADGHGSAGYLPMAIAGFIEEARAAAQPTFIPSSDASVFGQDNVGSPVFQAWPKEARAGRCLESALAVLAVAASQALHVTGRRKVPPALRTLLERTRSCAPPIEDDRALGDQLESLRADFTGSIFRAESQAPGAVA